MTTDDTERPCIMQNGHKLYRILNYTHFFPFQGPPNYAQIGIFGLKINIWQPCASPGQFRRRATEKPSRGCRGDRSCSSSCRCSRPRCTADTWDQCYNSVNIFT
jgi:hypothetical protein